MKKKSENGKTNIKNTEKVYDDWADWYPFIYGTLEKGFSYFERTIGNVLKSHIQSGHILDVGCGVGLSTGGLLKNGFDVTGVDISNSSLKKAKQLLQAFSQKQNYYCVDINHFQVDKKFDAVIAVSGFLEHQLSDEEQLKTLKSIVAFIKEDGLLLIDCYDHDFLMTNEPDDSTTYPQICNNGEFIYFERRMWEGTPRSRNYKRAYYKVSNDTVISFTLPGHAIPMRNMEEMIKKAGLSNFKWVMPNESGFYKPIAIAYKSDEKKEQEQLDNFNQPIQFEEKQYIFPENMESNVFEEEVNPKRNNLISELNKDGKKIISRKKQVTLVMFSGGIDSTYTLYKLLKESNDDIIAHHIHFMNLEGRHKAESMACNKIVEYLKKNIREFIYTESTIDRRRFRAFGMDEVSAGFEVGIVSQSYFLDTGNPISRWTGGICLEEELDEYGHGDVQQMEHTLNCAAATCHPNEPPRFFQLKIIPKKEQMNYMKKKLVNMCWTCRSPIWQNNIPQECGKCKTCTTMNMIRSGKETIVYPDNKN